MQLNRQAPGQKALRREIIAGLRSESPWLPAKLHYDERGSELFEQICEQPEYYVTRTELAILESHAAEIADTIGPRASVIEPGSGASLKTELLIDALDECAGYLPIDISDSILTIASERFIERFPDLVVTPVHADFMSEVEFPESVPLGDTPVVYFPGSTIGNFDPEDQQRVLASFARMAGAKGCLLVGFDRVKEVSRLEAAYDDAAGVTAEFNLNVLYRLRDEFDIDVPVEDFEFRSRWNEDRQAIVSLVVATRPVTIDLDGEQLSLDKGDSIRTEESHKYTPERIERLASSCGLAVRATWCDEAEDFAVVLLSRK